MTRGIVGSYLSKNLVKIWWCKLGSGSDITRLSMSNLIICLFRLGGGRMLMVHGNGGEIMRMVCRITCNGVSQLNKG